MTTQIAVRLPDELVAFVDRVVAEGKAPSRAAVVSSALERELRRGIFERDLQILNTQPDDGLDGLASWSADNFPSLD